MLIKLPFKFEARPYQSPGIKAFIYDEIRHLYLVQHRRSGKDKLSLQLMIASACRRVGLHLYLFPQSNQARKAIWKGIGSDGMRFIDHIPRELIKKTNDTEMSIELHNGSIIQLSGSSNVDALVGSNPVFIVYSEFPLHNPLVRQLLSPILAENLGTEILNGTPRGKNHGYDVFSMALQDPDWFVCRLTVEDTHKSDGSRVIDEREIDSFRRSGMAEEIIRQEFYCDWNIGNLGAYFTQEMDDVEYEGRICDFTVNPHIPIFASWDIGVRDATAITFFQKIGDTIDYIYYFEGHGKGIDYYASEVFAIEKKLGGPVHTHWGPHDLAVREWGSSAKTRIMTARDYGIHFRIVPQVSIQDRINAARAQIRESRFHKTNCRQLITALKEYMREYDDVNKVFADKPLHNWASHPVDAYSYGALAWREAFIRPDLHQPFKYTSSF
jgi:hypothetical protein